MIDALNLMATIFLGLYAGSLLTEAMILVPYWRKMSAEDFFGLHSELGPRLFRYFAPLTVIAVMSTVLVGILNSAQGNIYWVVSAVLAAVLCSYSSFILRKLIGVLLTIAFQPINFL